MANPLERATSQKQQNGSADSHLKARFVVEDGSLIAPRTAPIRIPRALTSGPRIPRVLVQLSSVADSGPMKK